MQFEYWQVLLLAVVPPVLVAVFNRILTGRAEAKKAAVQNDATVVTTVTDAMEALNEELSRVRTEMRAAEAHAKYVSELLESIALAMEEHKRWDDARVAEGSPAPPPMPNVPRWWEMRQPRPASSN